MTLGTHEPAVAGLYPIADVAGRHPAMLTDFVGDVAVTVVMDGRRCRLTGIGGLTDRGMEYRERTAADVDGQDVRVWAITQDSNQTFWAEPLAASSRDLGRAGPGWRRPTAVDDIVDPGHRHEA